MPPFRGLRLNLYLKSTDWNIDLNKFFTPKKLNCVISAIAVISMWAVWVIAYFAVSNEYLIPSFGQTMQSLWFDCALSAEFWFAYASTLLRTVTAFAFSFLLAALLAVLCALYKPVKAFVLPFMVFFRTLPTLAIILLLLVWTNPYVAPAIVTALVIFPMIHARLLATLEGIDGGVRQMLKVYGVKRGKVVFGVYLPMILPEVLPQVGADISLAIKITVSAEVLASTFKSLGGMMQESKQFLLMPRLAALTICAVITGLIVECAFLLLAKLTHKWSKREDER